MNDQDYINGFIQRNSDGIYDGRLTIDGVDISPIEGVFFKENGKMYLWLKRKKLLEYDIDTMSYKSRAREPRWEAYLEKQKDGVVSYRGECVFLRFKYLITGIFDRILGSDMKRLNLYVERLPMNQQTIINSLNNGINIH